MANVKSREIAILAKRVHGETTAAGAENKLAGKDYLLCHYNGKNFTINNGVNDSKATDFLAAKNAGLIYEVNLAVVPGAIDPTSGEPTESYNMVSWVAKAEVLADEVFDATIAKVRSASLPLETLNKLGSLV